MSQIVTTYKWKYILNKTWIILNANSYFKCIVILKFEILLSDMMTRLNAENAKGKNPFETTWINVEEIILS